MMWVYIILYIFIYKYKNYDSMECTLVMGKELGFYYAQCIQVIAYLSGVIYPNIILLICANITKNNILNTRCRLKATGVYVCKQCVGCKLYA